ncbi:MAG: hypothetical protein AABY64_00590 [Bdellovibrionota bacterium]
MKAKRFLTDIKFFRFGFFLSLISMLVIVTGPLALAEQTKNQQKEAINMFMKESGLANNKNLTMGEVWKNIRKNFPAEMQAKLDLPFAIYKDEKFPQIDFSELKDSKGNDVLAMNVSDGGDTARVEILGKDDVFMKFNGKPISANELRDLNAFANKIKDEKIVKKDEEKYKRALLSQPTVPTYEQWKIMSPYERAHFMVLFRLMVRETQEVLALHEATKPASKSSQLEKEIEVYLKLLTGENAFAAEDYTDNVKNLERSKKSQEAYEKRKQQSAQPQVSAQSNVPQDKPVSKKKPGRSAESNTTNKRSTYTAPTRKIAEGEYCIIGGYPNGRVTSKGICTLGSNPKPQFTNNCPSKGKPQISCNPVLYGYNRNAGGGPLCFPYDVNNPETTVATSKFCENNSLLRSGVAQDSYDMIQSILKEKGVQENELNLFKISKDSGKEIVTVEKAAYNKYMLGPDGILERFEAEKNQAMAVCRKIEANPSHYERKETRQQTKACDTLTKRVVSVAEAMASVQEVTAGPATGVIAQDPCPPTAAVSTPVVTSPGDNTGGVSLNTTPIATGPVSGPPVRHTAPPSPNTACIGAGAGGAAASNTCSDGKPCDGEAVTKSETTEKDDKKGFTLPMWAKTSLVIGAIAGFAFLTWWGLKKLFKRKNPVYTAPATSVGGGVATPITTPVITPIEGGTGTSSATGGGVR